MRRASSAKASSVEVRAPSVKAPKRRASRCVHRASSVEVRAPSVEVSMRRASSAEASSVEVRAPSVKAPKRRASREPISYQNDTSINQMLKTIPLKVQWVSSEPMTKPLASLHPGTGEWMSASYWPLENKGQPCRCPQQRPTTLHSQGANPCSLDCMTM
ncbi:UNVERIFIED_CONTAM: hypothetical protein FKN15_014174 [Acipenser sinensis]